MSILCLALLYLLAAFFLFHHLSDRALWGDEAETAILAKNITRFGVPLAKDEKNLLAIFPPSHVEVNEEGVWIWSPWLAPYLAAVSFKLFGPATFTARLPFVLITLASVALLRRLALALYEDEETALTTCLLLVTCVPFLVHSRQCRYYALLSFTQLWILHGYYRLARGERRGGLHLGLAMTAQFYSNYISFLGSIIAVAAHALLFAPRKKQLALNLMPPVLASAAAILPWIIYSGMLERAGFLGASRVWRALWFYVSETNFHITPLIMMALPLLLAAARRRTDRGASWSPETKMLVMFVVGQLTALVFFAQIYFRYLMAPLPLLILLEARALKWSFARPWTRRTVLALLIFTNWLGIASLLPFRGAHRADFALLAYIRGITSEYEDATENVVEYFLANAEPSESVFVMEVESPLVFYTGMRVIDGRFPENASKLEHADWVLMESPSSVIGYEPPLLPDVPRSALEDYETIRLRVRNTPLGASRPDPHAHRFLSADDFREIMLLKRKR